MRPATVVLLTALTSLTLLPTTQQAATASCAGPYLSDAGRLVLRPGSTVEVHGAAFANGCQDTLTCSGTLGCTTCTDGPEPTPRSDVTLSLRQRGRTWPLGTADAGAAPGELGEITWTVQIPTGAEPGPAILHPDGAEPTKVRLG